MLGVRQRIKEEAMRRNISEIVNIVKEQTLSGQSVPEFCLSRGLAEKRFYVWRQRAKAAEARFARVQTDRRIELELKSGATLKVLADDLKIVLEAL